MNIFRIFLKSPPKDMCLLILERGRGREKEGEVKEERNTNVRNINVSEKHQSVASCKLPNWELNLQPFGVQD